MTGAVVFLWGFSIEQTYYIICIYFPCRCEIQIIEDDAFQGLKHLSTLILTGNPVRSLARGAFSGLSSLQTLLAVETNLVSLISKAKLWGLCLYLVQPQSVLIHICTSMQSPSSVFIGRL